MAAVVAGTKRPFAAMSDDSPTSSSCSTPKDSRNAQDISSLLKSSVGAEGTTSMNPSARSTPRDTPMPLLSSGEHHRSFKSDVSIVLIGMRGTGKSTLAVIASMAYRRRVVDIDDLFQEATGFSTAKYRKQFGAPNHNLRQEELLQTALRTYSKNTVIVCNGGSLERNGQLLMQDFARTHPVIHIVRDLGSLHEYLSGVELQRLKDMVGFSAPILRRCSNYEFYNLPETNTFHSAVPTDQPAAPAFLTLKRAQRTFLKFLSLIMSSENAGGPVCGAIPSLEAGYPLSNIPIERRTHTCVVQVSLADLLERDVDIQDLERGSDAFEVIVDCLGTEMHQQPAEFDRADDIGRCISKIRRSTAIPVIYHVLPRSSNHTYQTSYLEHVHQGLRMAPDFATLDLSLEQDLLTEVIRSRGSTKIVGHLYSDKAWGDASWVACYEAAVRLGCDVVRFTRPAVSTNEEAAIQRLRCKIDTINSQVPLVCYDTGRAGRRSACLNQYLTPVVPETWSERPDFAARVERNPETPWLAAREFTQSLYATFTFDPMDIHLVGARLANTVSPAMHNAGYAVCGMPHRLIRAQTSSLNSLQEFVRNPNFGGCIIIQPFKIEVISLADSLSCHARAIGAVNTLIPVRHLREDGGVPGDLELFQERCQSGPIRALYGDNTEWIGLQSCVRRGLSPANAVRPATCGLVIGAGGMARAAVYALLQLGVRNIVIFNRTLAKAEKLVAHYTRLVLSSTGASLMPSVARQGSQPEFHILERREDAWPEKFRQPTIILSCIPVDPIDGGPAAHFTLPSQWMQSPTGGVVMEIEYKTLNTPLMQQIRDEASRFWTYMDGLDFILEQAFAQFELFTGKRAPRRTMREEVLRAWRDEHGNADPEMVERRLKAIEDQEP